MAITDEKKGAWDIDKVYDKQMEGDIWDYSPLRQLFITGRNAYGAAGQGSTNNGYSSPVQVPGTSQWNTATAVGNYSVVATIADGTLWGWGYNGYGETGSPTSVSQYDSPNQVAGSTWARASGFPGHHSALAVKTDGTLWSWGQNEYGQLGHGNTSGANAGPVQIGSGTDWSSSSYSIHMSGYYGMAIKTDGTLWMWGSNQGGMLGQNNQTQYSSPRQIPGTSWAKCGRGYNSSWAIRTDGTGWAWGQNGYGDLGVGNKTQYSSPKQIPGSWKMFGGMDNSGIGIKTDGTMWSWGRNCQGALGQNNTGCPSGESSGSPQEVHGTNANWDSVTTGWGNFMASKTDGTVWMAGNNDEGQMGLNNKTKYSSPVQLPGTWAGFENVPSFGDVGCFLKAD